MKKILSLFIFCANIILAQTFPAEGIRSNQPAQHALINISVYVTPTKKIDNCKILISDGVIKDVGENITIPQSARIWDCAGLTAYPGFIDLSTDYGQPKRPQPTAPTSMQQAMMMQQTQATPTRGSVYWNNRVRPENLASNNFLPDKDAAEKLRALGFSTVVSAPSSGFIRGTSAVVNLGDGNPHSQIINSNLFQHITIEREQMSQGYPNSLMGAISLVRQTLLDGQWYLKANSVYKKNTSQTKPEENSSLAALEAVVSNKQKVVFEVNDELNSIRAGSLAKEFNLNYLLRGNGYEYRRLSAIKGLNVPIILPVNFPDAPNVETPQLALNVELDALRHWDFAPENPVKLKNAGINFALTTSQLKDVTKFRENLINAVNRGLKKEDAIAALTTIPAELIDMENKLGTIENGKIANLVLTTGDYFVEKTKIREVWVAGKRFEVKAAPKVDARGVWNVQLGNLKDTLTFDITGEAETPSVSISLEKTKIKPTVSKMDGSNLILSFQGDSIKLKGVVRLTLNVEKNNLFGRGELSDGSEILTSATLKSSFVEKPDTTKPVIVEKALYDVVYPEGAFGFAKSPEQPKNILFTNATIWTSETEGILQNTDLLIEQGKIKEIGKNISAPKNTIVIDATGKHLSPGLIDCHSHAAISDGVNESGQAITSEVRIADVVNSDDMSVYRQLAGGLTSANLLHGSANAIGGQNQVIKLKWSLLPEEMKIKEAKPGIKFALGENPKQSNWGEQFNTRYPQTRMGVEQIIRDEFRAAQDYKLAKSQAAKNPNLIPVRTDLELEALEEILDSERLVHAHSYRQDEILMLMRVSDDFKFNIATFQHVLEGYKIAEEIEKHKIGASCFSDWWAYKYEVVDAIPYAGTIMNNVGVNVSFNSDSNEMARRMNLEAAKAVRYGGMSEEDALKLVTINPAKQLHLENKIGSIKVGKDADLAIWSASPLSTKALCEQTWIDGRKFYDRKDDEIAKLDVAKQRTELVQKILRTKKSPSQPSIPTPMPRRSYSYDCDGEVFTGGSR
ncbi:MAG: amidohydrolase family protein [Bacteroidetes bacterium]|nr:amidohydrolase family protein [Bacteroidota bacterium]